MCVSVCVCDQKDMVYLQGTLPKKISCSFRSRNNNSDCLICVLVNIYVWNMRMANNATFLCVCEIVEDA